MSEKGTLVISFRQGDRDLQILQDMVPLHASEETVLYHLLSSYQGTRMGVDVNPDARGVERLRPQVKALGISDVTWKFA